MRHGEVASMSVRSESGDFAMSNALRTEAEKFCMGKLGLEGEVIFARRMTQVVG